MNYLEQNRDSWNRGVMSRSVWAQPVDATTIAAVREGRWSVVLTPAKPSRATGSATCEARTYSAWPRAAGNRCRCLPLPARR